MSEYNFPLTKEGDECPMEGEQLAPGVRGYAVEKEDGLYIPVIIAEKQGNGDVGRFLDSLPRHKPIKIPSVVSSRLRGMLARRGFIRGFEEDAEFGTVEIWTLPALAESSTPPVEHGPSAKGEVT